MIIVIDTEVKLLVPLVWFHKQNNATQTLKKETLTAVLLLSTGPAVEWHIFTYALVALILYSQTGDIILYALLAFCNARI